MVVPPQDLVLYDGLCRFCRANIGILQRLDRSKKLKYLSLHDPDARHWVSDIAPADVLREMYVISAGGTRYGGAEAIRYLSRRLPFLWWLAPLLHIPGTRRFRAWLYRMIATRRYWFGRASCEGDVCSVK